MIHFKIKYQNWPVPCGVGVGGQGDRCPLPRESFYYYYYLTRESIKCQGLICPVFHSMYFVCLPLRLYSRDSTIQIRLHVFLKIKGSAHPRILIRVRTCQNYSRNEIQEPSTIETHPPPRKQPSQKTTTTTNTPLKKIPNNNNPKTTQTTWVKRVKQIVLH